MKIKDRPEFKTKPAPLAMMPDRTVAEAVREMSEKNYGSILVVDDQGKLVGIVTERDIMRRLVNEGRSPAETKLGQIMTSEMRVAGADDNLIDWLRIMSNERFRRLPVVDENNRPICVMTQGDFVSYTWPDLIYQGGQVLKATLSPNREILFVVGGVLAYTILLILILNVL